MKLTMKFTAVFEEAEEGGYIAFIKEIPGLNTQGETLEEAMTNLQEAFELMMETQRLLPAEELKNKNLLP